MGSKKFTKWIDEKNYKTCFKIVQRYYTDKEQGRRIHFLKKEFRELLIKRLFFVFVNLFRFNRNPYKKYIKSPNAKAFLKRLFGIYFLEIPNLLPEQQKIAPLIFEQVEEPIVSIIIAVHNHFNYTYNCLQSILLNTKNIKYEVVLINDCSSDSTSTLITNIKNITYLENSSNIGFLKSCNKATKFARGKYICFLNNDTQVTSNWLYNMLSVFNNDKKTGLVGAKLIFPYGLLQEAGGLVNYKGEPENYGRNEAPYLSRFNYLRETDYCSGACILILKQDFELLNGFDEHFAPAYYEDTDLCLSIRYQLNKKVYYQPLSEVIHFEGVSSGKTITPGNVKEYQSINSKKFKNKWLGVLKSFPITTKKEQLVNRFQHPKTILVVDVAIPEYDKASGARRLFELLKIFKEIHLNIVFLPQDGLKHEPYFSELINLGVRILYPSPFNQDSTPELQEIINTIDFAWISRPELNKFYAPFIKDNSKITWIYDTVDLHFIREERGLKLRNESITTQKTEFINSIMSEEIQLSKDADITIAITEIEANILISKGAKTVKVVPNIHVPYIGKTKTFSQREGICFIGGYYHAPNVDAVIWLVTEIMPLVWRSYPDLKLTIMGSNPTPEIMKFECERIEVTGYLEDISEHFISSKIFVAPLRYGAGMKGKIGQSLEFGLPVITTDIGAEGMDLEHKYNVLIANTKEEFAEEIIALYNDINLWSVISSNSSAALARYSPSNVTNQLKEIFNMSNNSE